MAFGHCPVCLGLGEIGNMHEDCSHCRGKGYVKTTCDCPTCAGTGRTGRRKCATCKGSSQVPLSEVGSDARA